MTGTLYLVGTPIGNLGDIAPRAVETLGTVDLIAAEDTRRTGRLLAHLQLVDRPLLSFFEGNERERTEEVLLRLRDGGTVALVTDGGMPTVSDPGFRLVRACAAEGIDVRVVPGPSAAIAALAISGLPTDRFVFEGFLPRKAGERRARLEALADDPRTVVLFESPKRVQATLVEALDALGDRPAAVARELTKLHEEVLRGRLSELPAVLEAATLKGEIVVVIGGADATPAPDAGGLLEEARALMAEGARARDAAKAVATRHGASANEIYRSMLGTPSTSLRQTSFLSGGTTPHGPGRYHDPTMGRDVFYITTPIYYPNDVPHIGHAYNAVATDYIARFHRLRGEEVFHLTGTDEHGLKLQRAAEEQGMSAQEWVDAMEPRWREVWARLDIAYDDYIRTTEARHTAAVQRLLNAVHDNGRDDIYLGTYEGLYCVSCEAYYTEEELIDGLCPIHERPVERMVEENYFFRLSAYADRLLEHYEQHPEAVQPETRRNEVLSTIRGGLQDFSISRTTFDWGIPLPWDPKHICYVWFDALTNYITAAGYADDPERFARMWPANIHSIGKDILRFHAIYWPAMLMAGGVELPNQVWAHGFLTVGGKKMSKTNATGIHPFELLDVFGVDSYRYYFMREIQFGQDGSFSYEAMVERHNADLANGLGNLASRVLAMLASNFDGTVPAFTTTGAESDLPAVTAEAAARYQTHMQNVELSPALAATWEIVARANHYLVEKEPWKIKDESRRDELGSILYASAETLRILAVLIYPIMPRAASVLWSQLGIPEEIEQQRLPEAAGWGKLAAGTKTTKGESLFPRLETE